MNSDTEILEEPAAGWLRYERPGEKPWYKSPVPRTVIRNAKILKDFLAKERSQQRCLEIDESLFSFKRRLGLRDKSSSSTNVSQSKVGDTSLPTPKSIVERLTRQGDITHLDHRKLLAGSAKSLDNARGQKASLSAQTFEMLRQEIASSSDIREILVKLSRDHCAKEAMNLMFVDTCLTEICRLNTNCGALVEFPGSLNENLYCKLVAQGLKECPSLMQFVIEIVTRRGEPILPSHVVKVATLFSSICYAANQELSALVKLRGLNLQVDGLSNMGIDMLSDAGLTQCARSIANHRDQFADIGPEVMNCTGVKFPYQSTIDNCDFLTEHLTVESIEKVS